MGGSGFPEKVLAAVRSVAGEHGAVLHEPTFGGNEERNLNSCLRSTFTASGALLISWHIITNIVGLPYGY